MNLLCVRPGLVALLALVLIGCDSANHKAELPPSPLELAGEEIGHYCNMTVADHSGPKGQIFVGGRDRPYWFSSVRDTVAFTLLPEEPKDIRGIYVNDMAVADWHNPQPGTWIEAREAWFVIESDRVGGMGAPEPVPFGSRESAEAFVVEHGGRMVAFADIPADAVLGFTLPGKGDTASHVQKGGMSMSHDPDATMTDHAGH